MAFRQKIAAFMYGRHGSDRLNMTMIWLSLGLVFLNLFTHWPLLVVLEYLLLGFSIFRFLSKNNRARNRENNAFVGFFAPVGRFLKQQKNRFRDRKTHVYKKCPSCKTVLRLPRIQGSHGVTCPRCKSHFEVKV